MLESRLPSVTDEAAWGVPATVDDLTVAAEHLITACEPGASEARAMVLAKMLRTRDWTRAELLEAMLEVPFRNSYGEGFRLDVMADVVKESRERRALLRRKVTEAQMLDLCADPEVEPEHFACCGFTDANKPLYIYAPDTAPHKHAPKPDGEVEDDTPRRDTEPANADVRELMFQHAPNLVPLDGGTLAGFVRRMREGTPAERVAADFGLTGPWEIRRYREAAEREIDASKVSATGTE